MGRQLEMGRYKHLTASLCHIRIKEEGFRLTESERGAGWQNRQLAMAEPVPSSGMGQYRHMDVVEETFKAEGNA